MLSVLHLRIGTASVSGAIAIRRQKIIVIERLREATSIALRKGDSLALASPSELVPSLNSGQARRFQT